MMVVTIQASTVRVIRTWWLRGRTTADGREKISGGLGRDDGGGEEEDEDEDVVVAWWMVDDENVVSD